MLRKIIFLFSLIKVTCISAQPYFDVFNYRFLRFPFQDAAGHDAKKAIQNELSLLIPFRRENQSLIITGTQFKAFQIQVDQKSMQVYSASIPIGYEHQLRNDRWKTLFLFIPKISADELNVEGNNFQPGGAFIIKFKSSDKLRLNAGLYYNREKFGNYFLPLAGWHWKASSRIHMFGILPNSMTMEFRLDTGWYAGLTYSSFVNTFNLHGSFSDYYLREGDESIGHNQLKCFLAFNIKKNFVIYAEGGYSYKREWELYDEFDEKKKQTGNATPRSSGLFYSAGIAYRIRFEE